MGMKGITIYTPPGDGPHIYAEDDAQIHRAMIGGSGITFADEQLACTIVNNNTVRLASGAYCMQGYMLVVQGGTVADLSVDSGTAGTYRHDLVVAEFIRGGGTAADQFTFKIIKGVNASNAQSATDPALTQDDLSQGGSQRQEALYRIVISETAITAIERMAEIINVMNATVDTAPTAGSTNPVTSGGVADAMTAAMPRNISISIPLNDWTGSGPYTYTYTLDGITNTTSVRAFAADQTTADAMPEPVFITPAAGRLTFTTAKKPYDALNVSIDLQAGTGTAGTTCIAAGAGGGKPYDDFGLITPVPGYLSGLTQDMNMATYFGDTVVVMLDFSFTSRYIEHFATIPVDFRPTKDLQVDADVWSGSEMSTQTLWIYTTGDLLLQNVAAERIRFVTYYSPRSELPDNQSAFIINTNQMRNAIIKQNLITRSGNKVHYLFEATFDRPPIVSTDNMTGLDVPLGFSPGGITHFDASATVSGSESTIELILAGGTAYYNASILTKGSPAITGLSIDYTLEI